MRQFYIAPTYRCNNRCPMCGVFNSKKDSDWKYTSEELKTEIDNKEIKEGDIVIVSGGEPTIYPYFFELIKYLNEKKARITIFSNGRAFKSKEFVNKMSECEYENLLIPLFGSNSEIHEKLVGAKGSFNDTFEGLKNLDRAGLTYSIKNVVMKDNYKDLVQWADIIIEKNISVEIGLSAFPLCTIDPMYWKYNIVSKIEEYTTISEDSDEIKRTNQKNYAERYKGCKNCRVADKCEWPWRMYEKKFELNYIQAF